MKVRARWQDAYSVRQRVEILFGGKWLPAWVRRKTATGMPVVLTATRNPLTIAIDRKCDIKPAEVQP
jgi:hypothetical protein